MWFGCAAWLRRCACEVSRRVLQKCFWNPKKTWGVQAWVVQAAFLLKLFFRTLTCLDKFASNLDLCTPGLRCAACTELELCKIAASAAVDNKGSSWRPPWHGDAFLDGYFEVARRHQGGQRAPSWCMRRRVAPGLRGGASKDNRKGEAGWWWQRLFAAMGLYAAHRLSRLPLATAVFNSYMRHEAALEVGAAIPRLQLEAALARGRIP